jgi:hypothetical protein
MKNIVVLLLVLLVFCLCAVIGYSAANDLDLTRRQQAPTATSEPGWGEQHNFLIIQVDQLDAQAPRLVSVWFISLFFMDDHPSTLTFAQLYAPYLQNDVARNMEKTFSLTHEGDPSNRFWSVIRDQNIALEGYFLVDQVSTQRLLEWLSGPADYTTTFFDPAGTQTLVEQTCRSVVSLADQGEKVSRPGFDWTGLAPEHFRSNVRMEIALAYWNRITVGDQVGRCEVILKP